MACTTLLVGRRATNDGSTIVARNEDGEDFSFDPKKMIVVMPEDQPRTYTGVASHLTIELPDNPLRYTCTPNADPTNGVWAETGINAANVSMSATETISANARVLGADPLVTYQPAQGKPGDADYKPEDTGTKPVTQTALVAVNRESTQVMPLTVHRGSISNPVPIRIIAIKLTASIKDGFVRRPKRRTKPLDRFSRERISSNIKW